MGVSSEEKSFFREAYKRFVVPALPDAFALKLRFYAKHGYWPNLHHPRSLMEKIVWLLKYDRSPMRAVVADRCKARHFVMDKAPDCKLPQQLWVGTEFTASVWHDLPEKFVIKGNHGSQMTSIVDKSIDRFEAIKSGADAWLLTDYSKLLDEWVYAEAERTLVVEEKLELNSVIPPDWKFICGNGRVLLVQLDIGRFVNHVRNLYDREFRLYEGASIAFPLGPVVEQPKCWDKAVAIAEQLAQTFDLIRVDLYIIGDDVYFGELTNYPGAGWDALKPTELDFEIGSKIKLHATR